MSLFSLLIASLIGSPHCAAMCGGFVVFYTGTNGCSRILHLSYNVGRLTTYLSLGLVAGFFGKALNEAGAIVGFQQISAVLLGLVLVVWGLFQLFASKRGFQTSIVKRLHALSSTVFRAVVEDLKEDRGVKGVFVIGMLSTLLPCGWLYSFVVLAAATGSPWGGFLVMLIFWVGTVPLMLLIGTCSQRITNYLGARLPMITASLMIIAGIFSVFGHLGLGVKMHHDQHGYHAVHESEKK